MYPRNATIWCTCLVLTSNLPSLERESDSERNEDHDEDGDPARVAQGRFGEIRALRLFRAGQSRWYQGVRRFRCPPVDRPGEVLATDDHL